jgi:hypothetical protein
MFEMTFQLGEPVKHRGIVVGPLFPRHDPVAAYLTLDEALAGGLRIRETSKAGSVPELVVENPLASRVLLYDGEEIVGAKQNRILNVSVLVEAKTTLRIPVSCVEQGRWHDVSASFAAASNISHAHVRRRKAEAQAAQPLARDIAQSEVWDEVRDRSLHCASRRRPGRARSSIAPTRTTSGRSRARFRHSRDSAGRFSRLAGTSVSTPSRGRMPSRVSGRSSGPATCSMHSIGATASPTPRSEIEVFVAAVDRAEPGRQPSAGLGQDVRLRGERIIGSGLELEGELIQLSAFTSEDRGRGAFGRIARPSRRR